MNLVSQWRPRGCFSPSLDREDDHGEEGKGEEEIYQEQEEGRSGAQEEKDGESGGEEIDAEGDEEDGSEAQGAGEEACPGPRG